ncbi:arginase family protein [Nonomuraea sp. NPDC005983]|uniref:arginase family protein n=1 Tax=Nonomuraea sp. NPDC005983 TaxID=3155595 RepID=UPI0033ACD2E7
MVVWFDAHGDLNTPSSSPSGAFHGMVLRALTREGRRTRSCSLRWCGRWPRSAPRTDLTGLAPLLSGRTRQRRTCHHQVPAPRSGGDGGRRLPGARLDAVGRFVSS